MATEQVEADDSGDIQQGLVPVRKPISLIPVGLKEAALDSPSFRATVAHFSDQVEAVEKWLDGIVKAASNLGREVTALESAVKAYLDNTLLPNYLSEASMDHDYTVLALRRYNEGARDFWSYTVGGIKRTQHYVVDPIRTFLNNEIKPYKDARRVLDSAQKQYDVLLARYQSQSKSKEPSSLREDAFQVHEGRKAYLKASMDICVLGPQVRAALDTLLIKVFTDQWLEMKRTREDSTNSFKKSSNEMERIRCWSGEMQQGEALLRRELLMARKEIEQSAEKTFRPSRDLESYSASTVPYLSATAQNTSFQGEDSISSKQGYLYMKTVVGKPARTQWVRRWCFCKNSVFGWLVQGSRTGGVEESEKIGVLLCAVKPAFQEDRRFCFDVKTKDTTTVLQAETQAELMEWISVFEVVKRRALEEPENADIMANMSSPSGDAAFAVNPPTAPELASQELGSLTGNTVVEEPQPLTHATTLGADLADGAAAAASRSSFDISTLRKGENERTRDHAARIISKLDLHKKSAADTQLSAAMTQSTSAAPLGGGIASLIAASHTSFPVGPGRPPVLQTKDRSATGPQVTTSLAPDTLASPPSQTNLTKTAILVGMDRGYDLGMVDHSGGMPSGLMANQWGTINHGQVARIERGEIRQTDSQLLEQANGASAKRLDAADDDNDESPLGSPTGSPRGPALGHRKTVSAADNLVPRRKVTKTFAEFPSYYPAALRPHDAQFRMLFPNIDPDERVVLIFRASWNATDTQDLPGRAYVTTKNIYFYSHYFGLTLVSGMSLDTVVEVSAASGQNHDMMYIKVRPGNRFDDETIIPIKTFLEPLALLQRRLNFLISNYVAEEPLGLEECIDRLIAMEKEKSEQPLPKNEDSLIGRTQSKGNRISIGYKVDRTHYGGDLAFVENDTTRFRLPAHPVNYIPQGYTDCAAQRTFNVSAKALFHIMFGDRSALFQLLYRQRRSQAVMQSPWVPVGENGPLRRTFDYQVPPSQSSKAHPIQVSDSQTIDVNNDHLCYAVTDLKIPWHLPRAGDFVLTSKIVITHEAKSKSKLAIYTKVDWSKAPWLSRGMIETQALDDLHLDAFNIVDFVTDQVDKLGPNTYTKKALAIYGPVGVATEASQIVSTDPGIVAAPSKVGIKRKSMFMLIFEVTSSLAASAISTILMTIVGVVQGVFNVLSMHKLLVLLLLLSISANLLGASRTAREWWHDRRTASFAKKLGITPDMTLSKAVYLKDLERVAPLDAVPSFADASPCAVTFQNVMNGQEDGQSAGMSGFKLTEYSTKTTARRLERTRRQMGAYRHDLLVSLRLVNRIEAETVQAEYESWLVEETEKCRELSAKMGRKGGEGFKERLGNETAEFVEGFLGEYCGSCEVEREAMMRFGR